MSNKYSDLCCNKIFYFAIFLAAYFVIKDLIIILCFIEMDVMSVHTA